MRKTLFRSGYERFPLAHDPCPRTANTDHMGNLLYIVAVILVIGWLLGVFVYSATGLIHLLLVIAIIAILLQVIRGRKVL